MFGVLKPVGCDLNAADRLAWRRAYCGTCKALGDSFGLASRTTLSFDSAMYALLVEAISEPDAGGEDVEASQRCRCPAMPIQRRPIVSPERPSVKAAAAVQMALTDQWLIDHRADGRPVLGFLTRWSGPKAERAVQTLGALGVDPSLLAGLAERQTDLEVVGKTTPAAAAAPTADMLAALFAHIPELAKSEASAIDFERLGHAVGTVVYLLDAVEDLAKDARREGAFNPALRSDGTPSEAKLDAVVQQLSRALKTIESTVEGIPWQHHQSVVTSALIGGLQARCDTAVNDAWDWIDAQCPQKAPVWKRALLWLLAPLLWVTRPLLMGAWGPGRGTGGGDPGDSDRRRSDGPAKGQRARTPKKVMKPNSGCGCPSCHNVSCCSKGRVDCCDAIFCCECVSCLTD